MITLADIEAWLVAREDEHVEFKEAKNQYPRDKLAEYCAALANEGGGHFVLGVTDSRPRHVVGTRAFGDVQQVKHALLQRLRLRIDVDELPHRDGRVLVFAIPSRPLGTAIEVDGRYLMRSGESLVGMTPDKLQAIFDEATPDYSAQICQKATLADLDGESIEEFRRRWVRKSGNEQLTTLPVEQLLADAELVVNGQVTYAALILFGTHAALGRLLAQSELVFEYRSSDASGPAQQRLEFRRGFFGFYDAIWDAIGLRNDVQHYQEGLFVYDIPTFDERSVREALLNAVSHRDYQLGGNIFVRQYPRRLVVESPGGLPAGITLDNILDRQSPRNRRIADAFARCGLVERSGQGMNLMFERSIQHGKPRPDFTGTDAYNLVVTLHGEVADPRFIEFVQKVGQEIQVAFGTHDFMVLDLVHRGEPIADALVPRLRRLLELGVVESVGRGRGTRYLLARRFYLGIGKAGVYTRKRGLDREENKALLLKHLAQSGGRGCPISELEQVLPSTGRDSIRRLLGALRKEGKVRLVGERKAARWVADEPVSTATKTHQDAT